MSAVAGVAGRDTPPRYTYQPLSGRQVRHFSVLIDPFVGKSKFVNL